MKAPQQKHRKLVLALGVFSVIAVVLLGFVMGVGAVKNPASKAATWQDLAYNVPSNWTTEESQSSSVPTLTLLSPAISGDLARAGEATITVQRFDNLGSTDLKQALQDENPGAKDKVKTGAYGLNRSFRGAELRTQDGSDVVTMRLTLRGGGDKGPAFQVRYRSPESRDALHSAALRVFLDSLALK